ncbi:sel1 repeat family protein [Flammeovirga sp. MY04]|uniref:SEL1-like repeat protein n=1 Tax=Flammeovirga sp. MY04 TaxID=1191459 RepID=UPI0008062999|nr:tetratricopeptide repeat protein [Flammeovirga sp. MY04]ANQ48184.1 sel1 repeat family protein [Flammeovirga sp. MY04]
MINFNNNVLNLTTFLLLLTHFTVFSQDIDQLKKQAKFNNDAESYYQLGLIYQKGEIEKVNMKKASANYEKAAILGHVDASLALAKIKREKGDYGTTIKLLKIASDGKSKEASIELGNLYEEGKYVTKDKNSAIFYYLRAWKEGDESVKARLEELKLENYNQKDSDVNYQEYMSQNGSSASDYFLGMTYLNGKEVPKDLNKSFSYFKKAADNGHAKAAYEVGLFYKEGLTGTKDSKLACTYFLKAANEGIREADLILREMDPTTLMDPENMDFLKYQALSLNKAEAQFKLFDIYTKEKNYNKALEMCQRAALQDFQPAMLELSDMYEKGKPPVRQSLSSAFKWRRQAAYVGSDTAEYLLGKMYHEGLGVQKSEERAVKWYIKAANHGIASAAVALEKIDVAQYLDASDLEYATYRANQGDSEAQLMLGKYYYNDNKATAISWLNKASDQQLAEAELYLGDIYKDGKCQTIADPQKAEEHYKKALSLGSSEANLRMALLYSEHQQLNEKTLTARGANSEKQAMQYANAYMVSSTLPTKNNTTPDPSAYLLMGDIHNNNNKKVQAIKQYDLYIKSFDEIDGNHQELITVFNKQANAYANIGELNSALLQIDIALAKADDFSQTKGFKENYSQIKAELFYTQAKLLFDKGDKYKACNVFQKAKALGVDIEKKYEDLCLN